ncbi:MAG: FecR family protein [Nitrospira sp.]|nr:FecR family protein [Nitrospira sp.]
MSEKEQNPSFSSPRDQALYWMVRLQSGEATADDRRRFESWVLENPTHRKEFEHFSKIWHTLDQGKPFLVGEIAQAEAFWNANRLNRFSPIIKSLIRWGTLPLGAMALAILIVPMPQWWAKMHTTENQYRTTKGEQQTHTLADGSKIMLNTDTTLSVRISDTGRVVDLQQGEALFTVTHDETRPFEVHAGNGIVHDLGTRFIIHKSHEKVNVSVLEGIVEVWLENNGELLPTPRPRLVKQDQQVWYTTDGRVSSIEPYNRQTASSWLEGRLVFNAQPLEQVIKEIGRYQPEEIRLLDSGLATIPVSGIFYLHDLGSFLQALQDTLPVRATRINPRLVIVERTMKSEESISNRANQEMS